MARSRARRNSITSGAVKTQAKVPIEASPGMWPTAPPTRIALAPARFPASCTRQPEWVSGSNGTKNSAKVFSFVDSSGSWRVKSDRGHHHRRAGDFGVWRLRLMRAVTVRLPGLSLQSPTGTPSRTTDPPESPALLGKRSVSSGRLRYASRRLSVLSGDVRMASRRDLLLPSEHGRSDFTSKGAEGYARISRGARLGGGSRLL